MAVAAEATVTKDVMDLALAEQVAPEAVVTATVVMVLLVQEVVAVEVYIVLQLQQDAAARGL